MAEAEGWDEDESPAAAVGVAEVDLLGECSVAYGTVAAAPLSLVGEWDERVVLVVLLRRVPEPSSLLTCTSVRVRVEEECARMPLPLPRSAGGIGRGAT